MRFPAKALLVFAMFLTITELTMPAHTAEMRGLWVDVWYAGFRSPAETTALVSRAKECNFNALFVQMRKRGDVCYRSSIEPMAKDITAGYDPLADLVTKAHAAGLQVHAWMIVYPVYHDTQWTAAEPNQVHVKHPEWLTKDDHGRQKLVGDNLYLDPGVPEVREYICSLVDEVVSKYNVDGIHLDKVGYPILEAGYNDAGLARFNKERRRTGIPRANDKEWCEWRRAQVTELVGMVYKRVSARKPGIAVSVAVMGDKTEAFMHALQDWEGWLKKGIIDFAVPMDFSKDVKVFEYLMNGSLAAGTDRPVYVGLGAEQISTPVYLDEVSMARKAGVRGVVIYCYDSCSKPQSSDTTSLMDALKADLFAKPDTVPAMPWKKQPQD